MGRREKHPVPPQPIAQAPQVAARLARCRRRLEQLQGERPALALASALGKPRADERLATLGRRIVAMEFEISCSVQASALASMQDDAALAAWRTKLQDLPAEKLLHGLGKDQCCNLCLSPAGCVLVGSDCKSAGACAHPIRESGPPRAAGSRALPHGLQQASHRAQGLDQGVQHMSDVSQGAPGAPGTPSTPPANATEARAVLDSRMADKSWGAKLFAGDVAATAEYRGLRDLINKPDLTGEVAAAMSGEPSPGMIQDAGAVQLRGQASYLRNLGLNEVQVRETLEGKQPTQIEIDMATQWKAKAFKSEEFRKRLFAGEPEERQQLLVANIILTSVPERQ